MREFLCEIVMRASGYMARHKNFRINLSVLIIWEIKVVRFRTLHQIGHQLQMPYHFRFYHYKSRNQMCRK